MHADTPGEFDIIARYFTRHSARRDVLLGVGDDAALLQVPADRRLVAAMDTLVEGVHFPAATAADHIGYRALAVNLSDLAAMGAEPSWALLSLSLPNAEPAWLQGFADGFFGLAARHGVELVGGDTVRGPLVVTVQVLGVVESNGILKRSGAQPGDLVYVSGIPGEAAAGLNVIQTGKAGSDAAMQLRQRFERPEPRVELGRALRTLATAAMDVSDGLLTDLGKLCRASGCEATLNLDLLPASLLMRTLYDAEATERFALAGGDDYELLFTLAPERVAEFEHVVSPLALCTCIGKIARGGQAPGTVTCLRNGQTVAVNAPGFDHFARQ
jgi:thiamine-monophosphate kinase